MKILITGATGFMGGNLLRLLAQDPSNELFYISRKGQEAPAAKGLERVTCLTGNINSFETLLPACKDMDIIYHVAAMVSSLERSREEMDIINVTGTNNILMAALENKVKKFVHVSTVDAVGMETNGKPATENTEYNFDTLNNPYADTKRDAEDCVMDAVKKGLPAVIVNPSFMIGAWDVKGSSARMILEIMRGKVKAYTRGGNSFVDVLDVCRGTILAGEKGKVGERYILAGHNLSYKDFFALASKLCGKRAPRILVPNTFIKTGAYLLERISERKEKKPTLSYNEAVFSTLPHYYSSEKAIKELGYTISPIEPAIERTRDWYLNK